MTPSQKTCPSCKLPTRIYATVCENCGHVFRTHFQPPTDQTQVLPVLPDSHFPPHLARRKKKGVPAAVLAILGVFVVAALLTAFAFARHSGRQAGISGRSRAGRTGSGDISGNADINTPGHLVRIADGEALAPPCSQQHVLETLGAPLENVNGIWSYPAEDGAVVGIKFAGGEEAKYVQGITILDNSGNLVWEKTPHLWKSMPLLKSTGPKHGLPLKTLKRYLDYITR